MFTQRLRKDSLTMILALVLGLLMILHSVFTNYAAAQNLNSIEQEPEAPQPTFTVSIERLSIEGQCPDGNTATPERTATYRLRVTNTSPYEASSPNSTVYYQWPTRGSLQEVTPAPSSTEDNRVIWHSQHFAPGQVREYVVTHTVITCDLNPFIYVAINYGTNTNEHIRVEQQIDVEDTCLVSCNEPPQATETPPPPPTSPPTQVPPPTSAPLPKRTPAIICDPAEQNCTNFLPELGVKFNAAQNPSNQPIICASDDPRPCAPNLPRFGLRFREAYADILAGECRVVADDVIALPAYHDALNRQADPAAAFMRPLYDSGVDFKKLVFENIILGIRNTKNARETLEEIHQKYWKNHADVIAQVQRGDIAGSDAIQQLNNILNQWRQEVSSTQDNLQQTYLAMQEERRAKFDPVATTAISNAEASIATSCPVIPDPADGGLEILLYEGIGTIAPVKEAYENHLTARSNAYPQAQAQFVQLGAIQQLWQQQLFPALTAFDQGNTDALTRYSGSQSTLRDELFFVQFEPYTVHQEGDEAGDNIIRLDHWEIALDTPKQIATDCEKEKVFNQPVETTQCESGDYPETIIRGAPIPEKAKLGGIAPPDTSDLQNNAQINPSEVQGIICGGRPGDPQWANDCSCQCGEVVFCDGENKFCEQCSNFGRHDIMVTSQEECLADGAKHEDPFF